MYSCTQPAGVQRLFSLPFSHAFALSDLYYVHTSLDFFSVFLYYRSFCTPSFDPLFLILGESQASDWRWYPLTCWPRGGMRCAWNRSFGPNCCPGRCLNLEPRAWQSSWQPLDHHSSKLRHRPYNETENIDSWLKGISSSCSISILLKLFLQ